MRPRIIKIKHGMSRREERKREVREGGMLEVREGGVLGGEGGKGE